MANGETCIRCGYQETDHIYPEHGAPICNQGFESSAEHHSDCPGSVYGAEIMCSGDCEATIAKMENSTAYWSNRQDPSALLAYITELRKGGYPPAWIYFK